MFDCGNRFLVGSGWIICGCGIWFDEAAMRLYTVRELNMLIDSVFLALMAYDLF